MRSMRAPFMERRYAKFDATSFLLSRYASYILREDELGAHKAVLVF
jgi:hypothetical protein